MRQDPDLLYRRVKVEREDGACWANDSQAGCTYITGSETLWLLAPNQTVLNNLSALFPSFL
jgi:hypothetical protein